MSRAIGTRSGAEEGRTEPNHRATFAHCGFEISRHAHRRNAKSEAIDMAAQLGKRRPGIPLGGWPHGHQTGDIEA